MRIHFRRLVLFSLGVMVLLVVGLLFGCGSDSTPGGAVKGKSAGSSKDTKMKAALPLLSSKEGGDSGKILQKPLEAQRIEVFPGITQEELEAKKAAQRAKLDPKKMEVFPGAKITPEQLEAKKAAQRAKLDPKKMEVFPGAKITQEQLEAKKTAELAKFETKKMEVFPGAGITQEQLEARKAAERANQDPKAMMQKWPRGPQ